MVTHIITNFYVSNVRQEDHEISSCSILIKLVWPINQETTNKYVTIYG